MRSHDVAMYVAMSVATHVVRVVFVPISCRAAADQPPISHKKLTAPDVTWKVLP